MKTTSTTFQKILNWEHWPSSMFYVPNIPYALYHAIKAKHLAFFTATNPAIENSGIGTESKYKTIMLVPEQYRPKTIFITPEIDFKEVVLQLSKTDINYPLIAKPDIGFRGLLVCKINSENELKKYLHQHKINIIIQEFLAHENECGIFYYRHPKEKTGTISSLTLKRFVTVTGNGKNNLKELILSDERAKLYYKLFANIHKEELYKVPKKGKQVKLTAIGNHSKGTEFINGNHLINQQLHKTFDKLSHEIKGWYYGRIDLKYNSFDDLVNGKDFKILEINGIMAEPTHIYDQKNMTYLKALKEIRKHWKQIYEISIENHKTLNTPYKNPFTLIKDVITLKKYTKKIKL